MARSKVVSIGGKEINIKESTIGQLRKDILPKLTNITEGVDTDTKVTDLFSVFEEKLVEFFPELSAEDVDNAYPSEIEGLIQTFIDVNFHGLKKVVPMVLPLISSFLKTGTQTQQ